MCLISILITSYNREQYLAEAIESVISQNSNDFELIICDDCSTDASFSIIQSYASKDNRIRIFRGEKNIGQFPNRNKAASLANGKLLIYVDSDDSLKPDALQYIVDTYYKFPYADFWTFYHGKADAPLFLNSKEAINKHFFDEGFLQVGPSGTLITKQLFDKIGGFPTKYGPAGDNYYNVMAACCGTVLLLPYEYFNYRRHEAQELNNPFSYLYNNYLYTNDLMSNDIMPLSENQKKYLLLKNKRRFLINLLVYFKDTLRLHDILKAMKLTRFTFSDIFMAIFQF
jgi:glycosyltransferase involved in cell wall biosynthesis